MQHTIRLYNLMWDNVSLINPSHLVEFVKGFEWALGNYGWMILKELYVSHSLTFNPLVEAEKVPARTAQHPLLRT